MKKFVSIVLSALMVMAILPTALATEVDSDEFLPSVAQEGEVTLIEAEGVLMDNGQEVTFANLKELNEKGYDLVVEFEQDMEMQSEEFQEFVELLRSTPVSDMEFADGREALERLAEELNVSVSHLRVVMPIDVYITRMDDPDVILDCKKITLTVLLPENLNPVAGLQMQEEKMVLLTVAPSEEVGDENIPKGVDYYTVFDAIAAPIALLVVG